MVVYADVLFAVNLLADYALLLVVCRLVRLRARPVRLLLGAAVGAVFAVAAVCVPWLRGWAFFLTFPAAAAVTWAAFWPLGLRGLLRAAAGYFAAGFLFSGMLLAVRPVLPLPGLYIQNNVVYYPLSLPVFFVLLCGLYGASVLLSVLLGERPPARLFCSLRLTSAGEEVRFSAKLDTGCALREPFSGLPVVLVSSAALGKALPPAVEAYLCSGEVQPGLRLVPYNTVNGEGLLPAFLPHSLLDEDGRPLHAWVAVTRRPLDGPDFSAVLNPAVLRDE